MGVIYSIYYSKHLLIDALFKNANQFSLPLPAFCNASGNETSHVLL